MIHGCSSLMVSQGTGISIHQSNIIISVDH